MSQPPPTKQFRIKLTSFIVGLITIVVATAVSSFLFITYQHIATDKLNDTRDLFFLELEHQAQLLQKHILDYDTKIDNLITRQNMFASADAVLSQISDNQFEPIKGPITQNLDSQNLGLTNRELKSSDVKLTSIAGKTYIVRFSAKAPKPRVYLWAVDNLSNFVQKNTRIKDVKIYIMNRSGHTIASELDGTEKSLLKRPIVQSFINLPVNKGLMGKTDQQEALGFFSEIARTNIILFGEIDTQNVLSKLEGLVINLGKKGIATILGACLLALILVWPLSSAMKVIARHIEALAAGKKISQPKPLKFKELSLFEQALAGIGDVSVEREQLLITTLEKRFKGQINELRRGFISEVVGNKQAPRLIDRKNIQIIVNDGTDDSRQCSQIVFCVDADQNNYVFLATEMLGTGSLTANISVALATMFRHEYQNCKVISDPKKQLEKFHRYLKSCYPDAAEVATQIAVLNLADRKLRAFNAGFDHCLSLGEDLPKDESTPLNGSEKPQIACHQMIINSKFWSVFLAASLRKCDDNLDTNDVGEINTLLQNYSSTLPEELVQKIEAYRSSNARPLPAFAAVRLIS